jgi:pimeloyl-ACP methyl ester carboxylesterase
MERLQVPVDMGTGPPVVLLHGFAMKPATYGDLARLLAQRCRVVVPDLFDVRGRWSYNRVLDAFAATLEQLDLGPATLIGHSFGGGIELGYAASHPEKVMELVFSDTLAVSHEWGLSAEALRHPIGLLRLATPMAATAFAQNMFEHPRQMAAAAWWGFTSGRDEDARMLFAAGIPAHVLWANRDSVLTQHDGCQFADELGASFTLASKPGGGRIDHDWMFQQPELFVAHLDQLGLRAFQSGPEGT